MKQAILEAYPLSTHLDANESFVLGELYPVFEDLLFSLARLTSAASQKQILDVFEIAIVRVNAFEQEIETLERETILGVIYDLGEIVGLKASGQFAEAWRGDW